MIKLIVDTDANNTVIALIDESYNAISVRKLKFVNISHEKILEEVEQLRQKYKISKIYVDKSGLANNMYIFLRKEIGYNIVIPITFERWRD